MRSATGVPIRDAVASATATRQSCNLAYGVTAQVDAYQFDNVASDGRYRMMIRSVFAAETVCVRVVGWRGRSRSTATDTAPGEPVTVRTSFALPRDSTRVDLIFR